MSKMTTVNPWGTAEQAVVRMLAKAASVEIDKVIQSIEIPPEFRPLELKGKWPNK